MANFRKHLQQVEFARGFYGRIEDNIEIKFNDRLIQEKEKLRLQFEKEFSLKLMKRTSEIQNKIKEKYKDSDFDIDQCFYQITDENLE